MGEAIERVKKIHIYVYLISFSICLRMVKQTRLFKSITLFN
jgi:hypothetical protein